MRFLLFLGATYAFPPYVHLAEAGLKRVASEQIANRRPI